MYLCKCTCIWVCVIMYKRDNVKLKRIRAFDLDMRFNEYLIFVCLIMYKRKKKCFNLNVQVLIRL